MFGDKNKKSNNEQELALKVNSDLVVRNMPSLARVYGTNKSQPAQIIATEGDTLGALSGPKNNFKMVGLVIIIGGLIFIGGLAYLSYVYIIKPQIQTNTSVSPGTKLDNKVTDVAPAASTVQVNTIENNIVPEVTPTNLAETNLNASSTVGSEITNNTNLLPLIDSDNDGLNDGEELILGTNPDLEDTNGNTYGDSVEINNSYDPVASGKLSGNTNLAKQVNSTYGYELLYPKNWTPQSLNSDSTLTFTTLDNSIIQVSVQENTDKQSILAWYNNALPDVTVTYDKLKSNDNWDGIMSNDGLNFYLTDKKRANIYVISYIAAVEGRMAYPSLFKLMINSFLIK